MVLKKSNNISWGNNITLSQQILLALYNIRKTKG